MVNSSPQREKIKKLYTIKDMKNENKTRVGEDTMLDEMKQQTNTASANEKKKNPAVRPAAAGVGAGILLGSAVSMGFTTLPDEFGSANADEVAGTVHDHTPSWSDGNLDIASSVSEEMSFSQAFAAARAELGPGGVFEWHGNVYATYTAEEWDNMSDEERNEFNDHFSWNHNSASVEDSSENESVVLDDDAVDSQEESDDQEEVGTEDDQEDVHEEPGDDESDPLSANGSDEEVELVADEDIVSSDDNITDVEILGVVHDDDSGANIGGMMVDGQEVILIDVDGSGTFDYVATDLNNDGVITEDEIADISEDGISVDDMDNSDLLGDGFDDGFEIPDGDDLDYVNDADIL